MLKYPVNAKIITVHGEEEYMVSHVNSFRYVEMDGEFIETPCQNFEEVPHTVASTKTVSKVSKITRPPLKMASLKDAKAVVEEDGCTIWGQLPDIPYKSDKLGLGFTSGAQKLFVVLVPRNHLCGSATMESTQWKIVMTVVTWKIGHHVLLQND